MAQEIAAILLGYLLGSIPFAHLVTRWRTGLRIREVGEGNVGARNVWHVVGPRWGLLVGMLDGLKGLGAVLLARRLGVSQTTQLLVGPAVILGHAFPLFLHFQGGKGVSTTAGVLTAWMPWATLPALATFALAQALLRDFNRSVIVGVVSMFALAALLGYPWGLFFYALGLLGALALKKWLDLAHERRVWATAGWTNGGTPGWYREPVESPSEPSDECE